MQEHPRQRRRSPRTAEEWQRTIADWRRSSLSGRSYAERHGLAASSVYKWASRLGEAQQDAASDGAPRFVAVEVAATQRVRDTDCALELEWPSGAVLRYRGAVSPETLAVVVRALAEVTRC